MSSNQTAVTVSAAQSASGPEQVQDGHSLGSLQPEPGPPATPAAQSVFTVEHLNFYYGAYHALQDINMTVAPRQVTAFIGPSGCGKPPSCAASTA